MSTSPARLAALFLAFLVTVLAGCGSATRPAAPAVTLGFCGSQQQAEPDVIVIVCQNNDINAEDLTWTSWGESVATGRGTAVVDLCAYSDCHTGSYTSVPIVVSVSKITSCAKKRVYSTLRYVFPKGSPWPGIPAGFNTANYEVGPHRQLPPSNQTVSLPC
jgi:hypothetical protein